MVIRTLILTVVLTIASALPGWAASNPDGVAVIIGNKNYTSSVPAVDYAHNDAEAIKRYVVDVLGYREGNIMDLRDATQSQLLSVFGNERTHEGKIWQYVKANKSDVVVFYSGHGVPGQKDKRGYLLPVDADPDTPEINGYPIDLLYENLSKINARSTTVFLDTCFSGESAKGMLIKASSGINIVPRIPAVTKGMIVITAAQGDQLASWDDEAKHGLFTEHLLDALYGKADGNGDGKITVDEIKAYLDDEMTYAARRRFGRHQQVTVMGDSGLVFASFSPGSALKRIRVVPQEQTAPALPFKVMALDEEMVAVKTANVREIPSTEGDRIGRVNAGMVIGVTGTTSVDGSSWYRVALDDGQTGYVFGNLLDEVPVIATTPPPESDTQIAVGLYYNPGDTFRDCADCPEMVVIPAGSFMMGSTKPEQDWAVNQGAKREWLTNETPRHRVTIPTKFAVGKLEITRGQYSRFVRATGRDSGDGCWYYDEEWKKDASKNWRSPGYDQSDTHPVVCVNWNDAKAYVKWLSRETGQDYRLLSESEWEYTARAGTDSIRYWGNDKANTEACRYGNVADKDGNWSNAFECGDGFKFTSPTGNYHPNNFGVYDVLGNVWEWLEDCYEDSYRNAPSNGSARTGSNSCKRVLRGGSWYNSPWILRSANRVRDSAVERSYLSGFRIARTL